MGKIIYSKLSNDRALSLSIVTEIMKEGEQLKVRKRAYTPEGQGHIDDLLTKYKKLSDLYSGSIFRANTCTLVDECAYFEYLGGSTLEVELDNCLISGDIDKFRKLVDLFVEEVKKTYKVLPFQLSEGFVKVFGEVDLPSNVEASNVVNIDLLFSNIIMDGSNWQVIDYEWVFDFLVPINFLIYRTFFYYTHHNTKRSILLDDNVMKWFGITSQELEQYKQMDYHFISRYVLRGKTNISGFHDFMGKETISLASMLRAYRKEVEKMRCQIFYDFGKGFNEGDSEVIVPKWTKEYSCELRFVLPTNVKSIRLDPGDCPCTIIVLDAHQITEKYNHEVEYISDSVIKDDKLLVFTTDDPKIIITNLREDAREIIFKFDYEPYGKNTASVLTENIKTMDMNKEMFDILEEKNQKLLNSMSWKITRPFRWINGKMRRVKQS